MNRKLITAGAMLLVFASTTVTPVSAETAKDTTRIEKLEERTRDLEARLAKVEASTHNQMGMMQHGHDMMNKGMQQGKDMMDKGMNNPMGQAPQQGMPQGNTPQQQQGGMPQGGMGDM